MVAQAVIPRPKLPVLRTVRDAYLAVITNFVQLLRIAWAWALSFALFEELIARSFGSELAVAILVPTDTLAGASIAVAWHRLLLSNERSQSRAYFRLDRLVWKYFASVLMLLIAWLVFAFLFLVLLLGLVFVAGVVAGVALGVLGVIASVSQATADAVSLAALAVAATMAMVLTSCLSIVLPARALDRTASFADAWRSTRSNRWRITIGTALTCAPPLLLVVLASEVSHAGWAHWAGWGWTATSTILGMLLDVACVGFLSYAYRHFETVFDAAPTLSPGCGSVAGAAAGGGSAPFPHAASVGSLPTLTLRYRPWRGKSLAVCFERLARGMPVRHDASA
jgi:hypothetical protein